MEDQLKKMEMEDSLKTIGKQTQFFLITNRMPTSTKNGGQPLKKKKNGRPPPKKMEDKLKKRKREVEAKDQNQPNWL
jgi:hypothetical protein